MQNMSYEDFHLFTLSNIRTYTCYIIIVSGLNMVLILKKNNNNNKKKKKKKENQGSAALMAKSEKLPVSIRFVRF